MSLESTRRVVLLTNTFLFRRCEETGIDQVLLGEKLRGWRKGIFNGFGGKVEAGESIRDAALRELHEEAGVEALDLEQQGVFWQTFDDKPDRELEIHVFRATKWSGTISKTDEMEPRWFAYDDIPYHNMWKDDTAWYPFLLRNIKFQGRCHFVNDEEMTWHDFRALEAGEPIPPSKAPAS